VIRLPTRGVAPPPSVTLPLAYLTAAAAAFVLAALALPVLSAELAGHYYHPRLLALVHVVALGWITLAIMGASYQMIPVALQRPLWSERLARGQLVGLVAGIVGMVGHFWTGRWAGLAWAAALVGAGALSHVVNVALSLRGLGRWTFTARSLALGLAGLTLTVAFGVTLAATHGREVFPSGALSAMHAHVHVAVLGWVAPMILGVAARVYPMFLLAPEPGGRGARLQLCGLGLGVPLVAAGLLFGRVALLLPGAAAVVAALGVHAAWVVSFARRRKRPALDWGLRFALTGTASLVPTAALGLALALGVAGGPRTATAYAVVALCGWVSFTIVGMMLKIVPFLVWYRVYAPRAGREPVPMLAQLSWPAAERLAYGLLASGTLALAVAVTAEARPAITASAATVAAGAIAFAAALGRTLLHLLPGPGRLLLPAPLQAEPR
jgi:hypothetical protein